MLMPRILTAAILLPMILWILILGPEWSMFVLLLCALSLSVFEMSLMLQPKLDEMLRNYVSLNAQGRSAPPLYQAASRPGHYRVLAGFCAVLMMALFTATVHFHLDAGRGLVVFGLIIAMLAAVFATRGIEAEMARVLGFVLTLVYAGFPWIVIWDLYQKEPGAKQLLLVLVVVWAGDTGGYFGGRFWGKTKLSPHKSPKKTWEGAVAGLTSSMAGALIYHYVSYTNLPGGVSAAILTGFLGGIAGQLGDLVESVFKRFTGVKDSGTLLPGHGGLLDRIDGVLFAAPVIWFILYCTAGVP